jgi:hypothetical protein
VSDFDMEAAVRNWRRGFSRERSFSVQDLDELEDHLRAAYEVELVLNPGANPARAFRAACETLGSAPTLSVEFAKVEGRGWRSTVLAGWVLFAVSFFLPVARYGITLGESSLFNGVMPGFEAAALALGGSAGVIGVLSGLTNFVMAGTLWRIRDASRIRVRLLALLMTLGVVVNLCWFVLTDDRSDLFAGYYGWLGSFGVVATGLWMRLRDLPDSERDRAAVLAS